MYIITNHEFIEITTNFSHFSNYSLKRSQIDCIHTPKNGGTDKNYEWLKNLNIYNDDGQCTILPTDAIYDGILLNL